MELLLLLLLLATSGPHGEGARPGVVEGGPRGATLAAVATFAVVLTATMPLAAIAIRTGTSTVVARTGARSPIGGTVDRGSPRLRHLGGVGGAGLRLRGEESRRWLGHRGVQRELLKLEIIADFIECQERTGPLQEGLHVVILGVETTKGIEGRRAFKSSASSRASRRALSTLGATPLSTASFLVLQIVHAPSTTKVLKPRFAPVHKLSQACCHHE